MNRRLNFDYASNYTPLDDVHFACPVRSTKIETISPKGILKKGPNTYTRGVRFDLPGFSRIADKHESFPSKGNFYKKSLKKREKRYGVFPLNFCRFGRHLLWSSCNDWRKSGGGGGSVPLLSILLICRLPALGLPARAACQAAGLASLSDQPTC